MSKTCGTVSYTHLDVYKRQLLCWGALAALTFRGLSFAFPSRWPGCGCEDRLGRRQLAADWLLPSAGGATASRRRRSRPRGVRAVRTRSIDPVRYPVARGGDHPDRCQRHEPGRSTLPVSYTHLDVYKRQVRRRLTLPI